MTYEAATTDLVSTFCRNNSGGEKGGYMMNATLASLINQIVSTLTAPFPISAANSVSQIIAKRSQPANSSKLEW